VAAPIGRAFVEVLPKTDRFASSLSGQLSGSLKAAESAAAKAGQKIGDSVKKPLEDSSKAADDFGGSLSNLGGPLGRLGSAIEAGLRNPFLAAEAAVLAFVVTSINAFADFDRGMREVFTLMPGITADAMGEVSDQIVSLGTEFGLLTEDTVPALYQAISAGVPSDNVFEFMETAVAAQIGGVTSLETAVDGITSVVNAYGEETINAAKASDLMFTAVRLGKTDFEQLSNRLFQVTPVAAALNLEFENVTAGLAAMTAAGVPTRVAATQLRQLLLELSKAGSDAAATFEEASGTSFRDFAASGGNVADALAFMQQAADDSGLAINDLFGSVEAGNAALTLTSATGAEKFRNALAEMGNAAGATQVAFETMADGIAFKTDLARAAVEEIKLSAGEAVAPIWANLLDIAIEDLLPALLELTEALGPALGTTLQLITPLVEALVVPIELLAKAIDAIPGPVLAAAAAFAVLSKGILGVGISAGIAKVSTALTSFSTGAAAATSPALAANAGKLASGLSKLGGPALIGLGTAFVGVTAIMNNRKKAEAEAEARVESFTQAVLADAAALREETAALDDNTAAKEGNAAGESLRSKILKEFEESGRIDELGRITDLLESGAIASRGAANGFDVYIAALEATAEGAEETDVRLRALREAQVLAGDVKFELEGFDFDAVGIDNVTRLFTEDLPELAEKIVEAGELTDREITFDQALGALETLKRTYIEGGEVALNAFGDSEEVMDSLGFTMTGLAERDGPKLQASLQRNAVEWDKAERRAREYDSTLANVGSTGPRIIDSAMNPLFVAASENAEAFKEAGRGVDEFNEALGRLDGGAVDTVEAIEGLTSDIEQFAGKDGLLSKIRAGDLKIGDVGLTGEIRDLPQAFSDIVSAVVSDETLDPEGKRAILQEQLDRVLAVRPTLPKALREEFDAEFARVFGGTTVEELELFGPEGLILKVGVEMVEEGVALPDDLAALLSPENVANIRVRLIGAGAELTEIDALLPFLEGGELETTFLVNMPDGQLAEVTDITGQLKAFNEFPTLAGVGLEIVTSMDGSSRPAVDGLIGLNGEVLDFANLPPEFAKTVTIENLGTEAIEIATTDLLTWMELTPEEKDLLIDELGATDPIAEALRKIREYNAVGIPAKVADIIANIDIATALAGFIFPGLASGGIVTQPTLALIGEGRADEVVIPLDDPRRAQQLASASGLIGLLTRAASPVSSSAGGSAVASGQAAGRSGVEVIAVGGNTFQISGATADEIMSKIETRERAQVRRRRRM